MSDLFTEADILLEILAEKDKVPLPIVAHVLGVSEEVVEKWAKVLEKHGWIRIHYPILGKPVLEIAAPEKIKEEIRTKFLEGQEEKSVQISNEVVLYQERMKNLKKGDEFELKKALEGQLAKAKGLSARLETIASKLGVNGDNILKRYTEAGDKYKEMLDKIENKVSMEEY